MEPIANAPNPSSGQLHEAEETSVKHTSELLDEGLEESFPASDPMAVSITRIVEETKPH
jgi:hypothetical protein